MDLQRGAEAREHALANNSRGRSIYACKDEPRILVPERPKWSGWTLNFAPCERQRGQISGFWILSAMAFPLVKSNLVSRIQRPPPVLDCPTVLDCWQNNGGV